MQFGSTPYLDHPRYHNEIVYAAINSEGKRQVVRRNVIGGLAWQTAQFAQIDADRCGQGRIGLESSLAGCLCWSGAYFGGRCWREMPCRSAFPGIATGNRPGAFLECRALREGCPQKKRHHRPAREALTRAFARPSLAGHREQPCWDSCWTALACDGSRAWMALCGVVCNSATRWIMWRRIGCGHLRCIRSILGAYVRIALSGKAFRHAWEWGCLACGAMEWLAGQLHPVSIPKQGWTWPVKAAPWPSGSGASDAT